MEIKWNGIVGHEREIHRLREMMREERLPHALLFAGPQGVGKRRVAETLAAGILCGREEAPCGSCASCLAMQRGNHPDYYLLEPETAGKAGRSIKIEQVRAMQTEASRMPILSGRRVVLIDGAELMNEAAENSLLKTLEEPVGQVVFLLVTSARASLLDTILSRCMPLSFGMLEQEEVRTVLMQQGISAQQAERWARLSDGSPGRAIQLVQHGGQEMQQKVWEFLEQMEHLSMRQVFVQGKELGELSRDAVGEWLGCLLTLLRDLLLLHLDGGSMLLYHPELRERLLAMLGSFPEQRLFFLVEQVRETQGRLRTNVNLRLLMERFLIQCAMTR